MDRPVVVVTGGSRGIGRAVVERFAALGNDVIACGRSAPQEPLPAGIRFVTCDVTDAAAVRRLFSALPRLDVLVNNAGLARRVALDEEDEASWHAVIATNLHGTYYCSKAATPLLSVRGGRIINISSVLGLRGAADAIAYCAAKHGVIGLTKSMALALARRNITVNAVCPGWTRTDMAEQRFQEIGIDEAAAATSTPTGRICAPADIAAAVLWLASPDTHNLTGQSLVIDGGTLA